MKPRILVVDNDADMVALLRRHLEVRGLVGDGRDRG